MFLLNGTTQWRRWGSNQRPLGLRSNTEPLRFLNICFNNSRKLQVGIGFLKQYDRDTPLPRLEKQLDPSGPIASQERSVRPSVNYVVDIKKNNVVRTRGWRKILDPCMQRYIVTSTSWADPEGARGSGPPLKNHKIWGFLAILIRDPKTHKATKPAFHGGSLSARQRNAISNMDHVHDIQN